MIEWFDDLKVGMKFKSDEITVSKEDILRFASEFDPQPFHLDEEAAKNTVFKGLAASGWHPAGVAVRALHELSAVRPASASWRRRRRSALAKAGAARRHASSGRGGGRAGAVEDEAARHRAHYM